MLVYRMAVFVCSSAVSAATQPGLFCRLQRAETAPEDMATDNAAKPQQADADDLLMEMTKGAMAAKLVSTWSCECCLHSFCSSYQNLCGIWTAASGSAS